MKDLLDRSLLILFVVLNAVAIAGTSYAHGRYGVTLPNPFFVLMASGITALGIRSCIKSVRR